MARRRKTLPVLEGAQAAAVDPGVHATLSASAGTGKTQVLTGRVLRLLLSGAAPETILCLTFTKAGAAEMANRIGAQLASWVRMPENDLKKDLFALGERDDPLIRSAPAACSPRCSTRPGACASRPSTASPRPCWRASPRKPGSPPASGRSRGGRSRSWRGRRSPICWPKRRRWATPALLADVQRLSLRSGEDGAVAYLMRCARAPDAMAAFGLPESIEPLLRRVMELPEESLDDYLAHHCDDDRFDCDLLRAIADANRRWATATGAKIVDTVERWLAMDAARPRAGPAGAGLGRLHRGR